MYVADPLSFGYGIFLAETSSTFPIAQHRLSRIHSMDGNADTELYHGLIADLGLFM
jgi:hypothetical protein